jgi:formylglycine-generating enzyme required for sulfatase activity
MRWIPPGEFTQGSRKSEAGRLPNETVREVVLTRGYWLADTPCTQQLWTAAMGKQPSRFRSPTRPVEQVGFQDVQAFLERLRSNAGLEFRLPREAEWEAACRAGTLTATYAGDLVIHGQRNAPQLDAIAWYGGNSGVDFDLEDGHDTKDWNEMQYPTAQAGTRRVKLKRPNAHGIYDMLGNVWEWCNDWYEEYGPSPVIDPAGPEQGSERVVRGGSWFSRARICRSAQRNAFPPEFRYHYLGFRLARGPEGKESETGAHKAPLRTQARDAPGSKRARPWRSKKGRGNKKR